MLIAKLLIPIAALVFLGCSAFVTRHEITSDNWDQVLLSEESQVKVRTAQSRTFDTSDRAMMLEAVVATFQDLGFQIEVLAPALGIVSGKMYLSDERPGNAGLSTYLLYDEESLVVFNRVYRTWGPFQARADLVRMTVTVRRRNEEQMIVRASAQHYLRAIDDPEAYQQFYAALRKTLFAQSASASSRKPSVAQ